LQAKIFLPKKQEVDLQWHKGAQRKKEYPNLANEKFLGVRKGLAAPTY
jgi:hypothetical protein